MSASGKEVYVVTIETEWGTTTLINESLEGSEESLYNWVVNNWEKEDPPPSGREDTIEEFFDGLSYDLYTRDVLPLNP